MLGAILKKSFWNTFDHLGALIILNLAWFVLSVPWLLSGVFVLPLFSELLGIAGLLSAVVAWITALWLNPASLWFLAVTHQWAAYRSLSRREILSLIRPRFFTGLWLSVAVPVIALIIGVNGAFYFSLEGGFHWAGLALAGITVWALIVLLLLCYHLGLMLANDPTVRVRDAIRHAFAVLMAKPLASMLLALGTLTLFAVLISTTVALPFAAMALPAMFAATGHRELLKRIAPTDDHDDAAEEVRTLRDLIKPWDMDR